MEEYFALLIETMWQHLRKKDSIITLVDDDFGTLVENSG